MKEMAVGGGGGGREGEWGVGGGGRTEGRECKRDKSGHCYIAVFRQPHRLA